MIDPREWFAKVNSDRLSDPRPLYLETKLFNKVEECLTIQLSDRGRIQRSLHYATYLCRITMPTKSG